MMENKRERQRELGMWKIGQAVSAKSGLDLVRSKILICIRSFQFSAPCSAPFPPAITLSEEDYPPYYGTTLIQTRSGTGSNITSKSRHYSLEGS